MRPRRARQPARARARPALVRLPPVSAQPSRAMRPDAGRRWAAVRRLPCDACFDADRTPLRSLWASEPANNIAGSRWARFARKAKIQVPGSPPSAAPRNDRAFCANAHAAPRDGDGWYSREQSSEGPAMLSLRTHVLISAGFMAAIMVLAMIG